MENAACGCPLLDDDSDPKVGCSKLIIVKVEINILILIVIDNSIMIVMLSVYNISMF